MKTEGTEVILVEDSVAFTSEGRLLQELGERLVGRPQVALLELIKNAYDADATYGKVSVQENGEILVVEDDGTGMTQSDFLGKWMRIATDSKQKERKSNRFKRTVTGEKGIGRFAVRYLGQYLELQSVAYDKTRGLKTRLVAQFDWPKIDKEADISSAKMPYKLVEVGDQVITGTKLIVKAPRHGAFSAILDKKTADAVLRMVNPLSALDSGPFRKVADSRGKDPGFSLELQGVDRAEGELAELVMNNYAVRAVVNLTGKELKIEADVRGSGLPPFVVSRQYENDLGMGCYADIRFFPRRPGLFSGLEVDGRMAYTWATENSGIAVFDHGVRIYPFGDGDNDWLHQDSDRAKNERQFRSTIMKEIYGRFVSDPNVNPMFHLPYKRQVIGAVFVESSGIGGTTGLIPSADREGFLQTKAFDQLQDIVRAAIELIAWSDYKNEERILEGERKRSLEQARISFRAVVNRIEASPTLAPSDKLRIIEEYTELARQKDEAIDYAQRSRQNIEVMSMLGVVAGFMTHESRRILRLLDDAICHIKGAIEKIPELRNTCDILERTENEFRGHIEYSSMFIDSLQGGAKAVKFHVKPQIDELVKKFGTFALERGIKVLVEIEEDCLSPRIPVAAYSGIALNLFTNAIKAVLGGEEASREPRIAFRAWNERDKHYLQVVDSGVGIPEDIRERIWDPLFTTTSIVRNPLGSGMGLGLSLVKRLVDSLSAKIDLIDPPPGYTTCFQLTFRSLD